MLTHHSNAKGAYIILIPESSRNTDDPLTEEDLQVVYQHVYDARGKWFSLGVALKIEIDVLNKINQIPNDNDAKLSNMLDQWLKESTNPTLRTLTEALRKKTVLQSGLTQGFIPRH